MARRPSRPTNGGSIRGERNRLAAEGQTLVLFAAALVALLGMVALSLDVGMALAERRQVQNAADAAAIAAARAVMDHKATGEILGTAQLYAQDNAEDLSADDITVSRPPASGPHAGDSDFIQVTVQKDVPRFFIDVVYTGDWRVSASAVAGLEPEQFDAAILALNRDAGGIQTSGSTRITARGGSVVSNFNIKTSGSTQIWADKYVNANDGFDKSGATIIHGELGENESAPEIPDPLLDLLAPPTLPAFPGNPVPTVNPPGATCRNYSPWDNPVTYTAQSGSYDDKKGNCINVQNIPSGGFTFPNASYRFTGKAGITIGGGNSGPIVMQGGTYNFAGGPGISVGGSTPNFEMRAGRYAFTDGASISIGGSTPNNVLGAGSSGPNDSVFYFSGGGGIGFSGANGVTLSPGTYIFNGGAGLSFSGSSFLQFTPGEYVFWFNNADMAFSGSSIIRCKSAAGLVGPCTEDSGVHVTMYFYGGADLKMSGSTSFSIPSGEYYFNNGNFENSGSTWIGGKNVFLYFKGNGHLKSTGSASFGFTAPETEIYPGYYPGIFMYADRANTSTFTWNGATSAVSRGVIYLPSATLQMGGSSSGKVIDGQIIADRISLGGSNNTEVEYRYYVPTSLPQVFLVE